jgi:hypothetical protein
MPANSAQQLDSHGLSNVAGHETRIVVVPAGNRQTVLWVIAVLLAVIATALLGRWDAVSFSRAALGQSATPGSATIAGARGIYAFTGQLGQKNYGLFMVDVDSATLWCYEMARGRDNEFQLQLVAARSWFYDRYLEEFNVAKPTPSEVQVMVRQQRGNAALANQGAGPVTGDVSLPETQPAIPGGIKPFSPAVPGDEQK